MNNAQRKYLSEMIVKEQNLALAQANTDYIKRHNLAQEAIIKKINGNKRFNTLTGRLIKTHAAMLQLLKDNHAELCSWHKVEDWGTKAINFVEFCSFGEYCKKEAGFDELLDKKERIQAIASDLLRRVLFPEKGEKMVVDAFEVLAKDALRQA